MREAEARRHHDQERRAVDETELESEEGRVLLRLLPERGHCAEIDRSGDHGDADRVAGLVRRLDGGLERLLGRLGDRAAVREEDVPAVEDVARGIAVGSGDAGADERRQGDGHCHRRETRASQGHPSRAGRRR